MLWLEMNLCENASAGLSRYVFSFLDDVGLPTGGLKAKEIAQTIFGQKIFKLEEFAQLGMLGSHSIRKFAATPHACRCGVSKDEKDIWGGGKEKVECRMRTMMLNYPTLNVKWRRC